MKSEILAKKIYISEYRYGLFSLGILKEKDMGNKVSSINNNPNKIFLMQSIKRLKRK